MLAPPNCEANVVLQVGEYLHQQCPGHCHAKQSEWNGSGARESQSRAYQDRTQGQRQTGWPNGNQPGAQYAWVFG
jgi:hypothetical protein